MILLKQLKMLLFLKIKIKLEKIINDFCNLFVLCTQLFYLINFVFTMGNSCYPFFGRKSHFTGYLYFILLGMFYFLLITCKIIKNEVFYR